MRDICKIVRMDWIHVRTRVLVPMLICTVLFLPFSLIYIPHFICVLIPIAGLLFYTLIGIDNRWKLERFYATLPFTPAKFVLGRFCTVCLGMLAAALWRTVLGSIAAALRLYTGLPERYALVLRLNATGYAVWQIALYTFTVCCLVLGFQLLLLYRFGTEHETAATLIGFPVAMVALVVLNIAVLEITGVTALEWLRSRLKGIRDAIGVLYAPFLALIGVLWMLLMAGICALHKRKGEWK